MDRTWTCIKMSCHSCKVKRRTPPNILRAATNKTGDECFIHRPYNNPTCPTQVQILSRGKTQPERCMGVLKRLQCGAYWATVSRRYIYIYRERERQTDSGMITSMLNFKLVSRSSLALTGHRRPEPAQGSAPPNSRGRNNAAWLYSAGVRQRLGRQKSAARQPEMRCCDTHGFRKNNLCVPVQATVQAPVTTDSHIEALFYIYPMFEPSGKTSDSDPDVLSSSD